MVNDDRPQMVHSTASSMIYCPEIPCVNVPKLERRVDQGAAFANALGLGQYDNQVNGMFNGAALQKQIQNYQEAQKPKKEITVVGRRIVQVIIADSDPKLPMENAILYRGQDEVTDSTDDEIFMELGVKAMLDKHNATRIKVLDKAASKKTEKDVFLEPVRIRDLKMVIVKVADL